MNDGRVGHYQAAHEILDEAVDQFISEEKAIREKQGIATSKLQLKTALARSVGLGNGADSDDAALKALYRLCSGETPLSMERAIALCQQIKDYRLIEWAAFRCGLLTTPRMTIDDVEQLDGEDVFAQVIEVQKETSGFVALLSSAYQSKPNRHLMNAIEDAHQKAALAMEKSAVLLVRFMEKMLKTEGKGRGRT